MVQKTNIHTQPGIMQQTTVHSETTLDGAGRSASGKWLAAVIFLSFASAYFLSYAVRTVNATLAPYLTEDLSLTPADLGWLSSAYFISFAVLQWPLGFWLDRYGARRVNAGLLLVAALGAGLMAIGTNLTMASIGRILIGVGVAACLMAPFSYFRRCYPPERQTQLGLWMLVAGTSGAVVSTLPVGFVAAELGWRPVFTIFAVLLLAAATAIFFAVPDNDLAAARADSQGAEPAAAPSLVRHPAVLRIVPLAMISQGGAVALQTLWIGPWLTRVLDMDNARMTTVLFSFMLVLMCCYIVLSFVSPILQRKGISPQRIALTGHFIAIPCIIALGLLPVEGSWILWFGLTIALPAMSLMQPALALEFPRAMAGRALTVYNLFFFTGVFFMQWGIGLVIDLFQQLGVAEKAAYSATLLTLATLQCIAVLWFVRSRPRQQRAG
jgi:predicted MFS family arabinose efflux permease